MSKALPAIPKHQHGYIPMSIQHFHIANGKTIPEDFIAACMSGSVKLVKVTQIVNKSGNKINL